MNILKKSYHVNLLIIFAIVLLPTSVQTEEISLRGPIQFTAFDKNGNGFVSEEEFNAVRGERMSARAAEGRRMRSAASAPSFSKIDTNDDGQLTQDELRAGQKAHMEKCRGMKMENGRGMGKGMGMGRNMPTFTEYDLNGDGKLLEKEFAEARSKRISERTQQGYQMKNLASAPSFADIDANGNGEISSKEFSAHQFQRRQQRAQ